jgi:putative DNA primase/helicase
METLADSSNATPPRFSEEAIALRFSQQYESELRYVSRWRQWLRWEGTRWAEDETLHVFDLARGLCRQVSAECGEIEKITAIRFASKATSAAIEVLARADRRHAATVEQWDRDTLLLNTPAGTVDLRNGTLYQHLREDYLTKITAASPGAGCSLWL